MQLLSSYPVLLVDDPAAARDFFVTTLGYGVTFETDWYVSLKHGDSPQYELGFVRYDHETVPTSFRTPTRGLLLNFEVADAASAWERLRDRAPVLLALRDEPFGQRHFILEGPGGVMVDVIENIPPAAEFAAGYTSGAGTTGVRRDDS